jgi:hypothetical protein
MPQQYNENVIQALAQHLGVPAREILLGHDLYRDWGLTPLSLVVVALDLERASAVEFPSHELPSVHTVADLVVKFRACMQHSDAQGGEHLRFRARRSRSSQSGRRLRRELHHLRWLEHDTPAPAGRSLRSAAAVNAPRP